MRLELICPSMNPADIACNHYPSFLTPTRVISKRLGNLVSALATSRPGLFRITSWAVFRCTGSSHPCHAGPTAGSRISPSFAASPAFVRAAKYADYASCRCPGPHKFFFFGFPGAVWAPQPHRAFRAAIFAAWAVTCSFHFNCKGREERIVIYRIHDST